MLYLGCHLSSSKGYLAMGKQARAIGANTFQFFTRNPRGGTAKALDLADVRAYLAYAQQEGVGAIIAHAPYTLNPCAATEHIRTFSRETMVDDLRRLEATPGSLYNFHPGSHVGQGAEEGVRLIAECLDAILPEAKTTTVLLETMAGKGSEMGGTFAQLREIIDRVASAEKLGVCLDTCHVWDGGYDVRDDLDGVLTAFDKAIGLSRLKAVHLNDSLNPLGAKKDRHAKIGQGQIGLEALARVINHPALASLPFALETPNEIEGYQHEIELLRQLYKGA